MRVYKTSNEQYVSERGDQVDDTAILSSCMHKKW